MLSGGAYSPDTVFRAYAMLDIVPSALVDTYYFLCKRTETNVDVIPTAPLSVPVRPNENQVSSSETNQTSAAAAPIRSHE